ncbi:hypothetical protein CHS0354_017516 [Potamilus streckersoni]|uniref:C1q domain-containing protein n=1 Tax=Potamilus streckersoni TaxID=2493646 RepID=A0AAE0S8G8_9BIVA|nr:hypothetical protein CHS0354_017516 [Potamilus streckersoni]
MNCLLLLSVLLPITFNVLLCESGAFEISENWDCLADLNTRLEAEKRRRNNFDINRNKTRPAFTAFLNYDVVVAGLHKMIFPDVKVNAGGHYNPITGVFTVPFTGTYFIHLTIKMKEVLNKNSRYYANVIATCRHGGFYVNFKRNEELYSASHDVLFDCNAGERMYVLNGPAITKYEGGKETYFTVFITDLK